MGIIIGIITGAVGMGYIVYGKRRGELLFIASGAVLIIYPYFIIDILLSLVTGIILAFLPFVLKRYL
jgi:hypothetical protein